MNKYKDSFETRSESLEEGGRGIMTAVRNEDVSAPETKKAEAKPFTVPNKNSSAISPIRTLADDLEQSVKNNHITLSQQALTKEGRTKKVSVPERGPESNRRTTGAMSKKRRIPRSFVFLFFTLIVFSASLYFFTSRQGIEITAINLPGFGSFFNDEEGAVESAPPAFLVQTDQTKELILTPRMSRTEVRELFNEESRSVQTGALVALLLKDSVETDGDINTKPADIASFLNILDPSIGTVLSRNTNEYTIGVSGGGEARTFLVAELISYEEIFGALLAWERVMLRELYGFFHNNISATTKNTPPSFSDIIVASHDARVLTSTQQVMNEDGDLIDNEEDVLIYSIIDKKTLIITHSREELARIISRLQ